MSADDVVDVPRDTRTTAEILANVERLQRENAEIRASAVANATRPTPIVVAPVDPVVEAESAEKAAFAVSEEIRRRHVDIDGRLAALRSELEGRLLPHKVDEAMADAVNAAWRERKVEPDVVARLDAAESAANQAVRRAWTVANDGTLNGAISHRVRELDQRYAAPASDVGTVAYKGVEYQHGSSPRLGCVPISTGRWRLVIARSCARS